MNSHRKRNLILFAVAVLSAIGLLFMTKGRVLDAYAVEHSALLLVDYLKQNTNRMPNNWESLKLFALSQTNNTPGEMHFDAEYLARMEKRVAIDFEADLLELAKTELKEGVKPFNVIYLRNGRNTHYHGGEPNYLLLSYLKKKTGSNYTPGPVKTERRY